MIMDSPQSRVKLSCWSLSSLFALLGATGKQLKPCVQTDLACLCLCWPQHLENVGKLEPSGYGLAVVRSSVGCWHGLLVSAILFADLSARTAVPCCGEEGGQRPGPLHLGGGLATLCYWITTIVFSPVFCRKPESLSGFTGSPEHADKLSALWCFEKWVLARRVAACPSQAVVLCSWHLLKHRTGLPPSWKLRQL